MMLRSPYVSALALAGLLALPSAAWGYRPFESTDADVVDRGETELELGYFNWERSAGHDAFVIPQIVYNFGLSDTLELVAEFEVEHADGAGSELADPAIFLKRVLRQGVLQDQSGYSVAIEAGLLLPSTVTGEDRVGAEAIGIVSGQLAPFTWHLNVGAGLDRVDRDVFGLWGVIIELPVSPALRFVGEVNGESLKDERPENSALLGLIWAPQSLPQLALDAGVRRGISRAAPAWQVTVGVSIAW